MSSQKNSFHVYPLLKETASFVQLAYCSLEARITRKISDLLLFIMHCCILITTLKWLETCTHMTWVMTLTVAENRDKKHGRRPTISCYCNIYRRSI